MNRLMLRLEGLGVLVGAILLYGMTGGSWGWSAAGFFAPDLSMIGYIGGARSGAAAYNLVHTYVLPLVLGLAGYLLDHTLLVQAALIWVGHIGMDRLLGYGLKYASGFKETHLSRV